mmetsp:Transcript_61658/g.175141  ORF Transcript_61658/g.175141 Transcript_61658/m.175141 type:complete len:222 (+) Transcript_61658:1151-1816(+)
MQTMSASGRCRVKASHIPATPSSTAMRLASSSAHLRVAPSWRHSMAATSLSVVSFAKGHGGGPTPALLTTSPQKCWSPKKGTMKVGSPKRSPAATVPAPPWWTAAEQRGRSQECGQLPRRCTPSGGAVPSPPSLDHEDWTRTRARVRWTASAMVRKRCPGSSMTMDPKPMKMGLSPPSRNAARAGSGSKLAAPLVSWTSVPTTSTLEPQSIALGDREGDHM